MRIKLLFLAVSLLISMAITSICLADEYIKNASEIVKAADWKQMKTMSVSLEEFSYDPDGLEFQSGIPYKIELKNIGEKKHYFTAPEFFRAIATRKVQSNKDGEIKAPYFLALEVIPNGQLDLYFVPVTKGNYPVYCTIDDHREQGMESTISIK